MSTTAKKKKKKKSKVFPLLLLIGLVFSIGIFLWPTFTDALYRITQTTMVGGYEEGLSNMEESEIEQMKRDVIAYNEGIYEGQKQHKFIFQGYNRGDDPEYDRLLTTSSTSSLMGYLEIPKISVYLPVTHGTDDEDLHYQVGHMYGTSLPYGGVNTHACLAAHTGLQDVDLFTDLVKLEIGDEFYIHTLNESHVYTVDRIKVVWPEETNDWLQIEDGQDQITLFTCTPYGINDHRLLVRGHRTGDLDQELEGGRSMTTKYKGYWAFIKAILIGAIPILILIIGLIFLFGKKKKKKKEDRKKKQETTNTELKD